MRQLITLAVLASCAAQPMTAAEHESMALHYQQMADSMEDQCLEARRSELTVGAPDPCWKAQDVRFVQANLDAAARERAAAGRLLAERRANDLDLAGR